jgi:hypothetical protein
MHAHNARTQCTHLRDLDLQLVRVCQVVGRHAKAPARNLLDRRAQRVAVAVGQGLQAARVLATCVCVCACVCVCVFVCVCVRVRLGWWGM